MTDCGANHVPPISQLGCQATQEQQQKQRHVDCDGRPLFIISVVVKVMARLYYGASGVSVDSVALDHHHACRSSTDYSASTFNYSSSSTTTTAATAAAADMNPRMYQQLFDLRSLVVTLIQKSPARNTRALTLIMMQALLLVNRIVTQCESSQSMQGLPSSLKSSPRALFLACVTVAEACLMDAQTSTRSWSKVTCVAPGEIARLKKCALIQLEFRVHVCGQEFDWWCNVVAEWMRAC
ncbi:hypothetical protein BJ741DRAFT_609962 [Chytriomyces cf. hyalinus JEL632]|nr:hypothetical protein BJ741DRAFT_609962 [Chytriomyces cf. hyalinus JEL632]